MQPIDSVTHTFTDPELVAVLKDSIAERMENALAREIGTAHQAMHDDYPVAPGLWPREYVSLTLWAARFALRLLDRRVQRDALLHAVAALARQRYATSHVSDLTPPQLRQCYYDAKVVLDQHWGRMTDMEFRYLDGDTRARIEQAAKE